MAAELFRITGLVLSIILLLMGTLTAFFEQDYPKANYFLLLSLMISTGGNR
jgi:hypothetical protein